MMSADELHRRMTEVFQGREMKNQLREKLSKGEKVNEIVKFKITKCQDSMDYEIVLGSPGGGLFSGPGLVAKPLTMRQYSGERILEPTCHMTSDGLQDLADKLHECGFDAVIETKEKCWITALEVVNGTWFLALLAAIASFLGFWTRGGG